MSTQKQSTDVSTQTALKHEVADPEAQIDPIRRQVINGSLVNICDEMGHKLTRTSYSTIIRESEDFGCALLDEAGRQLCETDSTPLQMGPIPAYVRGVIELFEERDQIFTPGDVIIHNDPYYGASHSPDVGIIVPVFYDDELTGFSVTTAHHLDIGADKPGTSMVFTIDSYSEALRLDAVKIIDAGERNETAWNLIADNIRVPDMVMGDLEAQISAARVGRDRLHELFDEYGHETVKVAGQAMMDYSERRLRQEIEKMDDGEYSAEGYIDGYLDSEDPAEKDIFLAVDLEVEGSDIHIDLSRCSEQLDNRPINMPLKGTVIPALLLTLRSTLLDEEVHEFVPQNEGITRPVSVTAPKGTIVNPNFPAPTIARFCPSNKLADITLKALTQVIPEKTCAGVSQVRIITFSGVGADDEYWVYMDITSGSYGGRPTKDGLDSVDTIYSNTRNNPIEDIETHYPLRVTRYDLRENDEGAGKYRGGVGTVREFELQSGGRVSIEGEGDKYAPWGYGEGKDGSAGRVVIDSGTDDEVVTHSKLENRPLEANKRIMMVSQCAGGWDSPLDRVPDRVRDDVLDGFISESRAESEYGVVLTEDLEVDEGATQTLRRERRSD